MTEDAEFGSQLASFREARRTLEASVLPLATSVDGRRFSFQASLHGLQLQIGGYVILEDDGIPRFGQVLSLALDRELAGELTLPSQEEGGQQVRTEVQIRYARGEGTILDSRTEPFHDALVRVAAAEEVRAWQRRGLAQGSSWASWPWPQASRAWPTRRASTGTRSSAASRVRERRTRWASSSNGC